MAAPLPAAAYNLPWPQQQFNMEIIFWALFVVVEPSRVFLGSKANKTETLGESTQGQSLEAEGSSGSGDLTGCFRQRARA